MTYNNPYTTPYEHIAYREGYQNAIGDYMKINPYPKKDPLHQIFEQGWADRKNETSINGDE